MNNFIDACLKYHRAVLLILAIVLTLGISAYISIAKERSPDVQIPYISVSMKYEGISPEDAERLLIQPMEKELKAIENVKEMTAYATEGRASITLEFNAGFDGDKALNDVREQVDIAKSQLPEDSDEPEVKEINIALFPIINVIISGNVPERALITIARDLQDELEQLPNVLSVNIAGNKEEVVEIEIDPMMVESYGLTLEDMSRISTGFNRLIASGALENNNGHYSIKVPGLLENLNDILTLPLKVSGDAVVSLKDVAKIKKTFKDSDGFARTNGKPAIVLEVSKRSGTNIVETIEQVKKTIEFEKLLLPEIIDITYSQDQSIVVFNILKDLENNIILAVFLVMIVIIYFIGMRSAFLITVAIPGAFLIGILFLYFMNFTLNIVVLFSLILSIGMLVDSAIIICEMADRKIAGGTSYKKAYIEAAKYMKVPIIASTATTLIVFAPLLFWPGTMGQFMRYMPITLISTLSGSLLMALIFVPTIGSLLPSKKSSSKKIDSNILYAEQGALNKITGFTAKYYHALNYVIAHSFKFLLIIFITLISVIIYYFMFGKGLEFFPDIEPENSQIQIHARGNLSVSEKDDIVKEVESKILDMEEISIFYAKSGNVQSRGSLPEDVIGVIQVEYGNWKTRRNAVNIINEIKARTNDIAGIYITAQDAKPGPGSTKPIEINLSSNNFELLEPSTKILLDHMNNNMAGLVDIEDSLPIAGIEWKMQLDRRAAARFGTDVTTIGNFTKFITNGLKVTSYRPNDSDDEVDIIVRFPENKRNLDALDNLKIVTQAGAIPASNFVKRVAKPKVETINRTSGYRVMSIKSNIAEGYLADDKVNEIKDFIATNDFDPNVKITFKGDDADQKESLTFLMGAFILALICMSLILLVQFNSFYYVLIILSAVFLSTIGVLIGLLITNQPFGVVMCGVGIISLSGIVVNNNIIFIDTYKKLKYTGISIQEALIRTGIQRLRPILLTSSTTVLGLVPMALGMNIDFIAREVTFGSPSSQWWRQLATAIAGGLTFATILTLFFTPTLLMLGERFNKRKSSQLQNIK